MGEHDILIGLWYVSTGDADYGYYPLLHSSSVGAVGNRSFYTNSQVDFLLDSARATSSIDERKSITVKFKRLFMKKFPYFQLHTKIM